MGTTITGRHVALIDVTVLSIAGSSVLALFRNASLEVTSAEIDVTAAQDDWKQREFGTLDWSMRCTNLVSGSPKYIAAAISGGVVLVSVASTGFNWLSTGMITGAPLTIDNPFTEEITIVSAGGSPTVSYT